MKKIITAKTFGSALAAILAGSVAGTTIFAYDGNYDYLFTYDNDSVSADTDADGAVDTASYSIDGTVITIAGAGTYVVTGSSEDGSITVEKNSDGVTLIFENLTLTSAEEGTVTVGKNSDTEIVIEGTEEPTRAFVAVSLTGETGSYSPIEVVLRDDRSKASLIKQAKRDMDAFARKYRMLKELAGEVGALMSALDSLDGEQ